MDGPIVVTEPRPLATPPPKEHFRHIRAAWLKETGARLRVDPSSAAPLPGTDRPGDAPHPGNYNPFWKSLPSPQQHEIKKSIHEAFNELDLSLDDTTPHRIKVAYRICREIATLTRAVGPDDLLTEALDPDPHAPNTNSYTDDQWLTLRELPLHLRRFGPVKQSLRELLTRTNSVSILPPLLPVEFRDNDGEPIATYDGTADQDPRLHAYCLLARTIYQDLGIVRGSQRWPEYGELGWLGLNDPRTIRQAFPTAAEIASFERVVVQETIAKIVEKGTRDTMKWLEFEFGLTAEEQSAFLRMARNQAMKLVPSDVDADQKFMVLRLEDLARRAREDFHYRDELMVLKQLAVVQGITRMESGDLDTQITTIIREFAKDTGPKTMAAVPSHIQLPPPAKAVQSKVVK